jgi:hypothetical protein
MYAMSAKFTCHTSKTTSELDSSGPRSENNESFVNVESALNFCRTSISDDSVPDYTMGNVLCVKCDPSSVDYKKSQFRRSAIAAKMTENKKDLQSTLLKKESITFEVLADRQNVIETLSSKEQTSFDPKLPMLQIVVCLVTTCSMRKQASHSTSDLNQFDLDEWLNQEDSFQSLESVDLSTILRFAEAIDDKFSACEDKTIFMHSKLDADALACAALLLGSYQIVRMESLPEDVEDQLQPLTALLPSYNELSTSARGPAAIVLMRDHWGGLWQAHKRGWLHPEAGARIDCGGGMHVQELVPGKIIGIAGPKDRPPSPARSDDSHTQPAGGRPGLRVFASANYLEPLRAFGTQAVVRLGWPAEACDTAGLAAHGLALADVPCDAGEVPCPEAIAKVLRIADVLPGAVAVHAGPGAPCRAGTLAGLYLMRSCGFSAREALAWLRLVRPGSVASRQQRYLFERESAMRAAHVPSSAECGCRADRAEAARMGAGEAARCVEEAVRTVDSRLGALRWLNSGGSANSNRRMERAVPGLGPDSEASSAVCGEGGQAALRFCADLLPLPSALPG